MNAEDTHLLKGRALVDRAVSFARAKKAEHIVLLNPGSQSAIADWFFICTGTTEIHNRAIADAIVLGLKKEQNPPWHTEGLEEGRWILLDYSDVIINIMLPEPREYYALEQLWTDCLKIALQE
jgi:ribosome-associated protein